MASADRGVASAGLRTMQLPAASAGAALRVTMAEGKFQGVMPPTTPSGLRVTRIARIRAVGRDDIAVKPAPLLGEPAEETGGIFHFDPRLGQGFSLFQSHELRKVLGVFSHGGRPGVEHPGPVRGGSAAPPVIGGLCGGDRGVRVTRPHPRNGAEDFTRGRVGYGKTFTRSGGDPRRRRRSNPSSEIPATSPRSAPPAELCVSASCRGRRFRMDGAGSLCPDVLAIYLFLPVKSCAFGERRDGRSTGNSRLERSGRCRHTFGDANQ